MSIFFKVSINIRTILPKPTQKEKVPDPNYNHNFAKNVVWTFENLGIYI